MIIAKVGQPGMGPGELDLGLLSAPRSLILLLAGELLVERLGAPVQPSDLLALFLGNGKARSFGALHRAHDPAVVTYDGGSPFRGGHGRDLVQDRRLVLDGDAVLEGKRKPPAAVRPAGDRDGGRIAETPVLLKVEHAQAPGLRPDLNLPLPRYREEFTRQPDRVVLAAPAFPGPPKMLGVLPVIGPGLLPLDNRIAVKLGRDVVEPGAVGLAAFQVTEGLVDCSGVLALGDAGPTRGEYRPALQPGEVTLLRDLCVV